MTLTVKFYSYDDRPGSVEVGELRWQSGGKVEPVSGNRTMLGVLLGEPIAVGRPGARRKVTASSDPEAFMRGLSVAYAGHFYASPAVES